MAGIGAGVDYGVHSDTLLNLTRGIVERVLNVVRDGELCVVPRPVSGVFKRLSGFRTALVRRTPSTPVVSREDYPLLYTGRKRVLYQRAYDSLISEAVSRRDARVKTFVKAEKINFSAKVDPAPRVIQPRDPRYNLEVGRYLKKAELALFQGVAKLFGYKAVVKGLNADEVGELLCEHWRHFRRPVAVGLDASRFDQHVSKEALLWEHSVYNMMFRSPELARLLKWQLLNRGVAWVEGHKVSYEVEGKRMSGDINTGLGNCLLMVAIVHAYLEHKGLHARLVNNGDDCVIICEQESLAGLGDIGAWFLDFGFTLQIEDPVYILEKVVFCQSQPVKVAGHYRMVRDPRVAQSKDAVSLQGWDSALSVSYWCHAIGSCGVALTRGVPVWEAWYNMLLRHGTKPSEGYTDAVGVSGMWYMARGVRDAECDDEARYSFYRAFDITPDEQLAFEAVYATQKLHLDTPMMFPDINQFDRDNNPLAQWSASRSHP